jgi:release factor glutamine methyltransferase
VPAEDTFFLAEYIKSEKGHTALEIGTGAGYLAKILKENFDCVVATDIDPEALKDQADVSWDVVCCDGASALGAKFDLVVCNLPYLPSDRIVDRTVDGGPEGLLIPSKIIESAIHCIKPCGKFVYLTSSLANYKKLISYTESFGFSVKVVAKKRLFFEEMMLIEAKKLN